jgi:AAA15 family ATPase/GTPase
MIIEVEIENFRCFGKSTFSGFSQINLIGGNNNAGKTAFLEALYLHYSPQVSTLMQLRGMNIDVIKAYPEKAWDKTCS